MVGGRRGGGGCGGLLFGFFFAFAAIGCGGFGVKFFSGEGSGLWLQGAHEVFV